MAICVFVTFSLHLILNRGWNLFIFDFIMQAVHSPRVWRQVDGETPFLKYPEGPPRWKVWDTSHYHVAIKYTLTSVNVSHPEHLQYPVSLPSSECIVGYFSFVLWSRWFPTVNDSWVKYSIDLVMWDAALGVCHYSPSEVKLKMSGSL